MDGAQLQLVTADRLLDGRGPVRDNWGVLFDADRILAVGPAQELEEYRGTTPWVHHYPQATVLPGLIDVHTHFNYRGDGTHTDAVMTLPDDVLLLRSVAGAERHLQAGVTTARECGAKNRTAFSLRTGDREGLVRTPRMVICGRPITITGGHMWQMGLEADGVVEVRRAVRQLVKEGADWIKVPATGGSTSSSAPNRRSFLAEELSALVDEAHNFDRLVGAHCVSTPGIETSLEAGVDMIIHATMKEPDGSWQFRPEVAERMAAGAHVVNPTLHVTRSRLWAMKDHLQASGSQQMREGDRVLDLPSVEFDTTMRFENARRLLQAGVKLIAGSDAGFGWYPFGQFWLELQAFTEIGMTPLQAIASATADAAEAIGLQDVTGTLEPGKEPDVLVVAGDPSRDIAALQDVQAVFRQGIKVA